MNFIHMRYLNIALSILYTIISIFVFFTLQVIASAAPLVLGLLIFYLYRKIVTALLPPYTYTVIDLILIGGFIGSIITCINLLKGIRHAISIPEQDNVAEDPKILSVVQSVSNDVGISPFRSVYLNSELDISTFYIGRERYLNLSVIALKYLTEEEIKAVIAHECAHHHYNAMLLNRTHYRAAILFESFANALIGTFSDFEKMAKKYIFIHYTFSSLTLLTLIPFIYIYRYFLSLMGILIRNAEYEYYCDSVAAKYVGGNVFASALQKVFDLHIAYREIIKDIDKNNIGDVGLNFIEEVYLESLNQEFCHIRYSNSKYRTKDVETQTGTHPPLILRLKRAQAISSRTDLSEPLLSEAKIYFWLRRLPDSSFIKTAKLRLENKQRLDAISKAQKSTGKALILIQRKRSFAGIAAKYKVFVNSKCVGHIESNSIKYFYVEPGLQSVYIKAGRFGWKSKELSLIISGGEQIEIDCRTTLDGIYISLKE